MRYKLWDITNNCWYIHGDIYLDEEGQLYCIEELGGYTPYMSKENVTARYEFLRFTGLMDCNGKDVYEGDIVKCFEKIGEVKWEYSQWRARWYDYDSYLHQIANTCEIIGNIHENPELLEAKA